MLSIVTKYCNSSNISYSKGVQVTIFYLMDKNLEKLADNKAAPMSKEFEKLADQYEGNLLNYFCGMTPSQSKRFNKIVKDTKKNRRSK